MRTAAIGTVVAVVAANFALIVTAFGATPAAADTAPADPSLETVSAAALPTVQINGVVWDQVIVGNRVFATGQFSTARPAGAAPGTNETTRSNILAYDLTTGNLITSWAPSLNAQGLEIKAAADGSTIYVGGDFTQVSGQARGRVAAIDAQTGALLPWNPSPNSRVDAIAVAGGTVYLGGDFTRLGASTRTRLAAVNAATGAVLSWAPSADQLVSSMVFHPGTGHLVVAGHFTTLNGTTQLGMGSLDGVTGAVEPWPVNTIIRNYDETAAINSLATDGTKVYGVGWGFLGGGNNGNFEGVFAADAATGALDWVDGGRGDNYDIAVTGNVLYTVGHPHDWGMLDWNPQTSPSTWQRAMAIDKRRSPTLTNAVGTPSTWQFFAGRPAAQPLHWLPTLSGGTYTGQGQAAWSVDTNGTYTVLGGEFPRVNSVNQQGLVRFAKRSASPTVDALQGFPEMKPVITAVGPGAVRLAWTAAWDRDNAHLKFEVLRGPTTATSTVIDTFATDGSTWWNRPPLGFVDATAPPGSNQTYRIRVTDPFGAGFVSSPTSVTIPAGAPAPSPYAAAVRADSPDWEWRMGERSGTTAFDQSGSNDLTLNSANNRNVPGALLNEADAATNFPGTSNTAPVQGASGFWGSGPQTFSIETWLKTTTNTGGKIVGFGANTGRSGANGNDRNLYMNNAGQIYFGVRPDMGTRITINSPSTYRDGNWHHVVATLGSDGMKLYVDGQVVATRSGTKKAQVYRGFWRVGGDNLTSWPSQPTREAITAQLDEIAVYPYALSASRIAAHYAASGRGGAAPNSPPTAAFAFSTQSLVASFDATSSSDSDGSIVSYGWNFGDGSTGSGIAPQHTYATAGTYSVSLTVTDDGGLTDGESRSVTVDAPNEPPGDVNASDTFSRTVSDGFGAADAGGTWSLTGPLSSFSVGDGTGRIVGAVGADRRAFLTQVRAVDVAITSDLALDQAATGGGAYLSVVGRRVSNGNDYRLKVRYQAGGSVAAYLVRTSGGTETTLATTTVPGLTVNAGDWLRVRFEVSGTTTSTLRAKVWRAGATEPAAWLASASEATPGVLQSAGDLGVILYVSGSWTGAAPVTSIDNLVASPPAG